MPRERNPNRDKARDLYNEHNGDITNRRIAELLGENEKVVAVWKQRDGWNVVQQSKSKVVQHRRGGQPGNKNAKGNRGGHGGPSKNDKAVKHGLFRNFLPDDPETRAIYDAAGKTNPLDLLWENIQIKFTAIVRAQRIMYVADKEELTKVLKKDEETGFGWKKEWEFQFAWDKQAAFLTAQARAMGTLASMIRQYEEMCRLCAADEEQQLRIEKLKAEVKALGGSGDGDESGVQIIDDIPKAGTS